MIQNDKNIRPVVLVDTFSFHTFENSGYFYCWYLSRNYDVVAMVDRKNACSKPIQTLISKGCIKQLILLPERSRHLARHRWFVRKLPRILNALKPAIIFMNNWHSYHQKYISRHARRLLPASKIIICLSVHTPITDFQTTDYRLREANLYKWRARWSFMPARIANLAYDVWGHWLGFRDFLLLPILCAERPLSQTHSPWLAKLYKKDTSDLFDAILCYADSERQAYLMEMEDAEKIHFVQHPMTLCREAVEALFSEPGSEKVIVALPSSGLDYDISESVDQQIDRLEAIWAPALEILQQRLCGMTIWWKLHPGFIDDPTMVGLSQRLEMRFPNFVSKTGLMSAEEMMVSAGVVVGDVSSVLVWASRLKRCKVFSLDLFGVEGGDEMGVLPGITVIHSLSELRQVSLKWVAEDSSICCKVHPTPLSALQGITSLENF